MNSTTFSIAWNKVTKICNQKLDKLKEVKGIVPSITSEYTLDEVISYIKSNIKEEVISHSNPTDKHLYITNNLDNLFYISHVYGIKHCNTLLDLVKISNREDRLSNLLD